MSHPSLTLEDDIYDPDLHEHDLDEADIVEWYEARPVTLSTAAAVSSLVGAAALGALVAVGLLALSGQFNDD